MTASYHVYFSAKEGVSSIALKEQVHLFMATQIGDNYASSYRLLLMKDKASFTSLPDYHLIVDYPTEQDLQNGFAEMKAHYKNEPHSPLMTMVADMKVAFSIDENKQESEQDGGGQPATRPKSK